uniref:Putative polyprotein n=1 Tax=Albugo laibachii Nc14 TaxID=890382 RepID=F0WZW8_9STRA|nr:putative polyprotein [Albugo laibachii Nc14]|eukprot:CCA27047.1 putative polyprotein [Albugo laibachii Nc14]
MKKIIATKWVFAIKRNEHGDIERYKARIVALGYRHTYGIYYMETYSPVANMNSIHTAFLKGKLKEEVYVYPPKGFKTGKNQVPRLNLILYGLKQAASTCYETISEFFIGMTFTQCKTDPCIFVRGQSDSALLVTLYVDDLLIGSRCEKSIGKFADSLSEHFKLKGLGDVRFVLGIEVNYNKVERTLSFCQQASISRMIEECNQVEAKDVDNPCVKGHFIAKIKEIDSRMVNRP